MVNPNYHSETWSEHDDTTVLAKRVKNYLYDYTNMVWRAQACNEDGEAITGESLVQQQMTFTYEGDAVLNELIVEGIYFKADVKVTKVTIFARIAPTGDDLKVDLIAGGVAQSKEATLSAGSQYEETDVSDETYLTSDRFGLKITQIGSTLPGTGISITIHYEKV